VTERRSGSSFSEGRKPEPFFFPAIDITRLGVSCYPTALLSNKLAERPLKFQRVTVVVKNSFPCMHMSFKLRNKQFPSPETVCNDNPSIIIYFPAVPLFLAVWKLWEKEKRIFSAGMSL
jgi:hypothetical protein